MKENSFEIEVLISSHYATFKLSRSDLVRRAVLKNVSKQKEEAAWRANFKPCHMAALAEDDCRRL